MCHCCGNITDCISNCHVNRMYSIKLLHWKLIISTLNAVYNVALTSGWFIWWIYLLLKSLRNMVLLFNRLELKIVNAFFLIYLNNITCCIIFKSFYWFQDKTEAVIDWKLGISFIHRLGSNPHIFWGANHVHQIPQDDWDEG